MGQVSLHLVFAQLTKAEGLRLATAETKPSSKASAPIPLLWERLCQDYPKTRSSFQCAQGLLHPAEGKAEVAHRIFDLLG